MAVTIEVRFFNSIRKQVGKSGEVLTLPQGSTVGDVLERLPSVPRHEIYLLMLNGRNVMFSLGGHVECDHPLNGGDVVSVSGPVPYSRSYGAPVC